VEVPVQYSILSHVPVAFRQIVLDAAKMAAGQAAVVPVHVELPSQMEVAL
jgi:hypothetical protein